MQKKVSGVQCSLERLHLLYTSVRRYGKLWQGRAVHESFDSNGVERRRQIDFTEASAVHKGEFLDFFNLCVGDIHFLW